LAWCIVGVIFWALKTYRSRLDTSGANSLQDPATHLRQGRPIERYPSTGVDLALADKAEGGAVFTVDDVSQQAGLQAALDRTPPSALSAERDLRPCWDIARSSTLAQ